ncbi:DnaJ heat shock amino-terminal domain protein [Medicago truncatula]|uniref:DnaJ heat shock amino-terminal domain protein n=1 Tax=Medicago truncatula TaxID=3880 RepID=A0A072TJU9_MEDTR|nr:DnaJ heat shock amino-terminal domain protein [Medicago truncatula]
MNSAFKTTLTHSNPNRLSFTFRFFHSTPPLERKRRNFWDSDWKEDIGKDDPSSSRDTSWFKKHYSPKNSRRRNNGNQGRYYKQYHEFCEDDIDVEDIFRSTFGGSRVFYWSFINEENPHWGRSGNFSNYGKSWKWKHQSNNRYDSSTESESESESECLRSNSVSDRLALGLSASGPLKLEDVKIAYRACALKWHPDRHQGSSKVLPSSDPTD